MAYKQNNPLSRQKWGGNKDDYHRHMAMHGVDSAWHNKQAEVLRTYMIDLKDYIVKLENERRLEHENTQT